MRMRLSCCSCAAALLLTPVRASSQVPRPEGLRPPTGRLVGEFTYLTSVRELADGRVLLSDPGEKRIVVADFGLNSVQQLGRNGEGPGEYRFASRLTALGGDSTLMADPIARRWLLFSGDRVVGNIPPGAPVVTTVSSSYVDGADMKGHLLTIARHKNATDSEVVILVTRASGRADTVARLPPPTPGRAGMPPPFSAGFEHAFLALDGWIAVLRLNPYRVDWRSPEGRWIHGAPIPVPVVRVTATEKSAYLARRRATPGVMDSPAPNLDWPATIPPVPEIGTHLLTWDGKFLVSRSKTAANPGNLYDVINHGGLRERQVYLPPNESILGFGKGTVYVVVADEDGVMRLRRHPWP
jgi:hypothetical protein